MWRGRSPRRWGILLAVAAALSSFAPPAMAADPVVQFGAPTTGSQAGCPGSLPAYTGSEAVVAELRGLRAESIQACISNLYLQANGQAWDRALDDREANRINGLGAKLDTLASKLDALDAKLQALRDHQADAVHLAVGETSGSRLFVQTDAAAGASGASSADPQVVTLSPASSAELGDGLGAIHGDVWLALGALLGLALFVFVLVRWGA
jgi:hypothetical protein